MCVGKTLELYKYACGCFKHYHVGLIHWQPCIFYIWSIYIGNVADDSWWNCLQHQFAEFQSLGKQWEAYSNQIWYLCSSSIAPIMFLCQQNKNTINHAVYFFTFLLACNVVRYLPFTSIWETIFRECFVCHLHI